MYKPTVTDGDLARLREERDRADRLYNDALTALDRAVTAPGPLPAGTAPPDTSQLRRLESLWQVVAAEPVPFGGWRGRIAGFVWRLVGPTLQRQQEFNGALLEHLRRNAAAASASAEAAAAFSGAVGDELQALARLQSRLINYLQQVTLYVDTKDRYEVGTARYEMEHRAVGLAAGLSAVGDELLKRWESVNVRGGRADARFSDLQAAVASLSRKVEGLPGRSFASSAELADARESEVSASVPLAADGLVRDARRSDALASRREDAAVYAGFEDAFRGATTEIGERLGEYLPVFTGASDVLDVGCGRGEFLQALVANGISGRGVDVNVAMVERCRGLGLDVTAGDAIEYLDSLPDASLGGLFAAQVVEHLQPERLLHLLAAAHRTLRPGAPIVLETVNPACWYAFFSSYIRDITHVKPIHPDTLRYLLSATGFQDADIRYSSPYPRDYKLHPLPQTLRAEGSAMAEIVDEFNGNVEKLNELLFTYLDYAAIGTKGS